MVRFSIYILYKSFNSPISNQHNIISPKGKEKVGTWVFLSLLNAGPCIYLISLSPLNNPEDSVFRFPS